MGPDTKLLTAAEPVAQGIRAAILAASGFSGPLDVIENRRGFLSHFSYAPRPALLGGLGQSWLTDTIAYKEHPGCAYLQPAVEAVLRLQSENGFEAGDVARINVRAGWLTTTMEKLGAGEPLTGVRVNFSVALSCAAALIAARLTHEELTPGWLAEHEENLRDVATRVFLEHDWQLTARTIQASGGSAADLPLRRLPSIRRRMQDTGMDEVGLGLADLREAAKHLGGGGVRGGIRSIAARRASDADESANGASALDAASIRMTFPCHVSIQLRSGGVLETDGRERGGSGASLEEQQAVVGETFGIAREAAEMPKAWRRRPTPAAS
jgi:hypothetical protein